MKSNIEKQQLYEEVMIEVRRDPSLHKAVTNLRRLFRIYGWVERETGRSRKESFNRPLFQTARQIAEEVFPELPEWDIIASRLYGKALPILTSALVAETRKSERQLLSEELFERINNFEEYDSGKT